MNGVCKEMFSLSYSTSLGICPSNVLHKRFFKSLATWDSRLGWVQVCRCSIWRCVLLAMQPSSVLSAFCSMDCWAISLATWLCLGDSTQVQADDMTYHWIYIFRMYNMQNCSTGQANILCHWAKLGCSSLGEGRMGGEGEQTEEIKEEDRTEERII